MLGGQAGGKPTGSVWFAVHVGSWRVEEEEKKSAATTAFTPLG
jgi:nicotinamide mononucleotide (NMN) deamidase PncC